MVASTAKKGARVGRLPGKVSRSGEVKMNDETGRRNGTTAAQIRTTTTTVKTTTGETVGNMVCVLKVQFFLSVSPVSPRLRALVTLSALSYYQHAKLPAAAL